MAVCAVIVFERDKIKNKTDNKAGDPKIKNQMSFIKFTSNTRL